MIFRVFTLRLRIIKFFDLLVFSNGFGLCNQKFCSMFYRKIYLNIFSFILESKNVRIIIFVYFVFIYYLKTNQSFYIKKEKKLSLRLLVSIYEY